MHNKHCFPLLGLYLGYPRTEPEFQKGRLAGTGVIHWDKYHRLSLEERNALVLEYDDKKKHLGLTDNWHQEGIKHYLDWFYLKWAQQVDTTQITNMLKTVDFLPKNEKNE